MGVHHLAFATKDVEANHRFYTEAMGFELVKVEVAHMGKGWAKHLFYSTGPGRDQLIAFWDLHDPTLGEWSADISRGQGLPPGVNHLAFSADGMEDLGRRRDRWLAQGHDVMEIDHDWCWSVYTTDPNGIMVEFCTLLRDFTAEDRAEALRLLKEANPSLRRDPKSVRIHKAAEWAARRTNAA
jgi:catechol 2,3-dioxygenase-like lactoylglutathione lyase family enzyme